MIHVKIKDLMINKDCDKGRECTIEKIEEVYRHGEVFHEINLKFEEKGRGIEGEYWQSCVCIAKLNRRKSNKCGSCRGWVNLDDGSDEGTCDRRQGFCGIIHITGECKQWRAR